MSCSLTGAAAGFRRLVLVLVAACAMSLLGVTPSARASERPTPVAARATADRTAPPVEADFPRLPSRCYDAADNPVLRCQVTSYAGHHPTLLLWGDSHAWMYLPALRKLAKQRHVDLVLLVAGGCPPAVPEPREAGSGYTRCETHDVDALDYVQSLADRGARFKLILGAFWSGYREEYRLMTSTSDPDQYFSAYAQRLIQLAHDGTKPLFERLGALGVATDVIGQAAVVPNHPHACAAGTDPYRCNLKRPRALPDEHANRTWLKRMMDPLAATARYIDATPAYCTPSICSGTVGSVPTFYDQLHLGARFTATLSPYFLPSVDDLF